MLHRLALLFLAAGLTGLIACSEGDPAEEAATEVREIRLGPADGQDLPPTDLERVATGDLAPAFTAVSLDGDTISLAGFRGEKNVVLVFYRGHW